MALNFDRGAVQRVFDALVGAAQQLGVFDAVLGHEPKSPPGQGVSFAIWWSSITPVPAMSGLNAVTGLVQFQARAYKPFLAKPEDATDPSLLAATSAFLAALAGAFTLGGIAIDVDLLGAHGQGLRAQAAYGEIGGNIYRLADIDIPVVIDNLWSEVP